MSKNSVHSRYKALMAWRKFMKINPIKKKRSVEIFDRDDAF